MEATDLLQVERQARIQKMLAQSGRVLASELAQMFDVSEDTIRRDLRDMASAGLCKRVYGGALPVAAPTLSLTERSDEQTERKRLLAQMVVSQIATAQTVFLDASSVNMVVAHLLVESGLQLTIVTNTPAIAAILLDAPTVELIVIGGPLDRRISACVAARALRDAELLRPDLSVLGVCAVDVEAGVTAHFVEDAEFKRLIATRSRRVLLAVTNDKLGTSAPHDVIALQGDVAMIVEHDADASVLAGFENATIHLLHAPAR